MRVPVAFPDKVATVRYGVASGSAVASLQTRLEFDIVADERLRIQRFRHLVALKKTLRVAVSFCPIEDFAVLWTVPGRIPCASLAQLGEWAIVFPTPDANNHAVAPKRCSWHSGYPINKRLKHFL